MCVCVRVQPALIQSTATLCIRLSLTFFPRTSTWTETRPRPWRRSLNTSRGGGQGARFYSLMEVAFYCFFNLSNLRDHRCCDCCCCDSLKLHNTENETFLCGSLFPLSMHFITQDRGRVKKRSRLLWGKQQSSAEHVPGGLRYRVPSSTLPYLYLCCNQCQSEPSL